MIDLSKRLSEELGRPIGIHPETKHPKQGVALEPELVKTLNRNGLNRPDAKVFVQSFEVSNLIARKNELRFRWPGSPARRAVHGPDRHRGGAGEGSEVGS